MNYNNQPNNDTSNIECPAEQTEILDPSPSISGEVGRIALAEPNCRQTTPQAEVERDRFREAIHQAWAEYHQTIHQAWIEHDQTVEQFWTECGQVVKQLLAEFDQAAVIEAWAEYDQAIAQAEAEINQNHNSSHIRTRSGYINCS